MASFLASPTLYDVGLTASKGAVIGAALWSAGSSTAAVLLLPGIYSTVNLSPKLAAQQWAHFYWTLSGIVPKCELYTVLACSSFAYLGYKENSAALAWKIWAAAAVTHPFGWMWVWNFMLKTPSEPLVAIGKQEKQSTPQVVLPLIQDFTWKMGVRAFFPWMVGALAFVATQSQ